MKSDAVFPLEQAGWPAFLLDTGGKIRRANSNAQEVFGASVRSETANLSGIWHHGEASSPEAFMALGLRSSVLNLPLKLLIKDGSASGFLASMCSMSHEGQKLFLLQLLPEAGITRANHAAQENTTMLQKQKLDCAMQLARTIALDFNNALTSILGHTSLLLGKAKADHPWRQSLLEVEKAATRAEELAHDLSAFSRQEKNQRAHTPGNLNLLVQRTAEFCQQGSGDGLVSWNLQLERQLFAAKFDEAKMQQALVNILQNAAQALPGQGSISIQTRNFTPVEPTRDHDACLAPGAYVCVEITDNGCGIASEIMPRIFEPFFTTKDAEEHRGLGLAWVYGVVTNHGGAVAISSRPGNGTSVRLYLPAEPTVVLDSELLTEDLNGKETVLIVDDEDLLLTMGRTVLSDFGYRVLTANSGHQALDLLTRPDQPVNLVVTDLVMPSMSGRELIEQIHQLSPAMPILCTSGCTLPPRPQTEASFLQKPFTSKELLSKVKQCLAVD